MKTRYSGRLHPASAGTVYAVVRQSADDDVMHVARGLGGCPVARGRGRMTVSGIYQIIACRGRQCGIEVFLHRFRHHFSHTWLDHGGAEGGLMELNGWTSPQMLRRYDASAPCAASDSHQELVEFHVGYLAPPVAPRRPKTTSSWPAGVPL